jgi:GT2 family glycosyltransferase
MIDIIPYDSGKRLGYAYNQAFRNIPSAEVLCLRDGDTCWLTPDYMIHIDQYHRLYPDAVLTCFTNRVSPLSKPQLLTGSVDPNPDLRNHLKLAEKQKKDLYKVTEITRDISGVCMIVPRAVWEKFPFDEELLCLGVDTYWNRKIREAGIKILLMQGVYIFHSYRLLNGIHDKKHLLNA